MVDQAKIAALQKASAAGKSGGKGAPRRKVAKVGANPAGDDKKVAAALKKLAVAPIAGIEEVNMFQENGNVLHFSAPKVHAAVPSNTYAIYGNGQEKELTELVPGILNQLGPDSLASLRRMAESYSAAQGRANAGKEKEADDDDDDDVPDLVESFDLPSDEAKSADAAPADTSSSKLEELE